MCELIGRDEYCNGVVWGDPFQEEIMHSTEVVLCNGAKLLHQDTAE